MYNENHQLTREGALDIIRRGGSVLLKGKNGHSLISKPEDVPDDGWFATNQRVTRTDAENAIKANGVFTYKGVTYHNVEDLPEAEKFNADHKAALDSAREAAKKRRDDADAQLKRIEADAKAAQQPDAKK